MSKLSYEDKINLYNDKKKWNEYKFSGIKI